MTPLAWFASILGGCKVVSCLVSLYSPNEARRMVDGFARNEIWGWILTAVDLAWAGWLVLHTPPFSAMKSIEPMVYVGCPLAFFLVVIFLDEMLSARALGGFLLLLGSPLMMAARTHDSAWSLIMTLVAYVWVVLGMVFVVSPYRLRQMASALAEDGRRFRGWSLAGLAAGGSLLLLGLTVYR